jgi:FolB domain-containing protein
MDQYDTVSLRALPLTVTIGPDVWHRSRAQPIYLTLHIYTSLAVAGQTDDVADTVHYGHLGKKVQDAVSKAQQFTSLFHLVEEVCRVVFRDEEFRSVMAVKVEAEAQKVLLQAEGLYVRIMRLRDGQVSNFKCEDDIIQIRELTTFIIIGVNPPERLSKQRVFTTITFHLPSEASQNAIPLSVFLHYEICQNLIKVCIAFPDFATR